MQKVQRGSNNQGTLDQTWFQVKKTFTLCKRNVVTTGFAMYARNLTHLQPYLILYHKSHQYTQQLMDL